MDIKDAELAYHSNVEFRALVDHMVRYMFDLHCSPVEMRAAATFAAIRFEQMQIRPRQVPS